MADQEIKLFRDNEGRLIKPLLSPIEGISFRESPLDFFILLARYKFAARLLKKKDHVLDAGCGHGHGSVFLSHFASRVTGADADQELVANNAAENHKTANLDFTCLNLLDIADHTTTYDVVVSMDVIEHFSKDKTDIVAQNYAHLTKDSGFAIIGTPNIASQPFASQRRRMSHIHEFGPDDFEALLSKYFKNVFLFSMTDELVSTSFNKMAWYFIAVCTK